MVEQKIESKNNQKSRDEGNLNLKLIVNSAAKKKLLKQPSALM